MHKYAEISIKQSNLKKNNTYTDDDAGRNAARENEMDIYAYQKQINLLEWLVRDNDNDCS
jgi:hypothetical protein